MGINQSISRAMINPNDNSKLLSRKSSGGIPLIENRDFPNLHEYAYYPQTIPDELNQRSLTTPLIATYFYVSHGADEVYICGSWFQNKKAIKLQTISDSTPNRLHGIYLYLEPGCYSYRYRTGNGEMFCDKEVITDTDDNGITMNFISVVKTDENYEEALDSDQRTIAEDEPVTSSCDSFEDEDNYMQLIPDRSQLEDWTKERKGPPQIPPQLNNIILNNDIPNACEPMLLQEPHHTMLKHLCALSIKDGVMVLSSTHRFRKKFITTVLYKPL
ncbi:hypothetical protein SNEBB_009122 [Seison nebaliae]|nr:hypothetical protein SNEBB_009122 [Seison nebaliae]